MITDENLDRIRGLNRIAEGRGQTLAQMAIAWILRDQRKGTPVTSALVGASSVRQLEDTLSAINNLDFTRRGAERHRRVRGGIGHQPLEAEITLPFVTHRTQGPGNKPGPCVLGKMIKAPRGARASRAAVVISRTDRPGG